MRTMTRHAECAKAIRKELKEKFPHIKFSVRSESFSMGNAVNIYMSREEIKLYGREVHSVVDKYEYGHFDGMIDLYECDNVRDDIPQVKYVMVNVR